MHILHYVSPLQKYYIRILWMVPIYAIESWLALRFKEQKAVLETAREAYEAWVIYSFYKLMLTFVGETDEIAQATIDALGREHAHMMFPLHKIKPWKLRGGQFLRITSVGVFQYVWIRTFFGERAQTIKATPPRSSSFFSPDWPRSLLDHICIS